MGRSRFTKFRDATSISPVPRSREGFGSCAPADTEPCQARKGAAIRYSRRVPQISRNPSQGLGPLPPFREAHLRFSRIARGTTR